MNASTSRQSPAEGEDGRELLARTARDLPAGRHQYHKERLMAHIQQEQHTETAGPARARGFRLPRPAITLPAMATAVAGAVVALMVMPGGESGRGLATGPAMTTTVGVASAKGVPQLLDRLSLEAARKPHPVVKPGQYVYIESKMADTFVRTEGDKSTLASHELHTRQIWQSPDGTKGWLVDPAVNDSPEGETLSLPDEQGRTPVATLNAPSYDLLVGLTTDPGQLLARIYKESEGKGTSPDQQAFTTIGDLLGESYPPADLSAALFKAAGKIPGVVVVQDAVDAAGRQGVAVARLDETSGQREEWIFDSKTHAFLGKRVVQVKESREQGVVIRPGTVMHTSAIMKRAIVDDIKQTPSQAG